MRLDDFDRHEAGDASIVAGGAKEVGFRLVDDPFANGVLMDVGDAVHEEAGLAAFDPERAAAVLPKMVFLQHPEGPPIFFKALEHPLAAEIHFHFDGFQQCRRGEFFEVPFEISGGGPVFCTQHEVEVAAHQAPGEEVEALGMDKMGQRIGDDLLIGGP